MKKGEKTEEKEEGERRGGEEKEKVEKKND
jgi:hypothetical protein